MVGLRGRCSRPAHLRVPASEQPAQPRDATRGAHGALGGRVAPGEVVQRARGVEGAWQLGAQQRDEGRHRRRLERRHAVREVIDGQVGQRGGGVLRRRARSPRPRPQQAHQHGHRLARVLVQECVARALKQGERERSTVARYQVARRHPIVVGVDTVERALGLVLRQGRAHRRVVPLDLRPNGLLDRVLKVLLQLELGLGLPLGLLSPQSIVLLGVLVVELLTILTKVLTIVPLLLALHRPILCLRPQALLNLLIDVWLHRRCPPLLFDKRFQPTLVLGVHIHQSWVRDANGHCAAVPGRATR